MNGMSTGSPAHSLLTRPLSTRPAPTRLSRPEPNREPVRRLSWARHFTLTVPLSTQVYKWVPTNVVLGVKPCDGLASHPGGSKNTPSCFMLWKPG